MTLPCICIVYMTDTDIVYLYHVRHEWHNSVSVLCTWLIQTLSCVRIMLGMKDITLYLCCVHDWYRHYRICAVYETDIDIIVYLYHVRHEWHYLVFVLCTWLIQTLSCICITLDMNDITLYLCGVHYWYRHYRVSVSRYIWETLECTLTCHMTHIIVHLCNTW